MTTDKYLCSIAMLVEVDNKSRDVGKNRGRFNYMSDYCYTFKHDFS